MPEPFDLERLRYALSEVGDVVDCSLYGADNLEIKVVNMTAPFEDVQLIENQLIRPYFVCLVYRYSDRTYKSAWLKVEG
jgi:hypothetical protein